MGEKIKKYKWYDNIFVVFVTAFAMLYYGRAPLKGFHVWVIGMIQQSGIASPLMDMLIMAVMLAEFILPIMICFLYIYLTRKDVLQVFKYKYEKNNSVTFGLGMLTGFLMNSVLAIAGIVSGSVTISYSGILFFPLLLVLACGVIQCSCEEIMYRGYVYQYLKGRYGVVIAILTGSICFSLGHIGNIRHYGLNIAFLLNVVLVGVVLALFMRRFGSIWFAFGLHTMWNFTQQFIFGFPNSGISTPGAIFTAVETNDSFFFNNAFGIEGTWGATILFVLIVLALIILEYKKPE
ncbi:MAG: CPBP family intramembrane metalloprotease [Lachnospiraceae bacterium]|nr:CPBP family intramembrane metalloprotease [Lachnospiraceae bacterium]